MGINFTVEDGSGLAAATSYISVEDADQYHEDRGNADWAGVDAVKQSALIKATQYLDAHYLWATGRKATKAQALGWPRLFAEDADGYTIESTEVPTVVGHAAAELARQVILGTDLQPTETRRTSSETVFGAVAVTYEPGASPAPRFTTVDNLLAGLVYSGVQGLVVRA
jgi:hypothetical protein